MLKQLKKLAKSVLKCISLKELKVLFKIKKKFRNRFLTPVMLTFTYLGSAGFLWIFPTMILMKKRKNRFSGFLVLVGITYDFLLNNLLTKLVFHRRRPWKKIPGEFFPYSLARGFSFPSGHALTNSTVATILILDNKRNIIWVLPITGLILFSRLYFFAHYPSDVITGALEGILVGKGLYDGGHKLLEEGKLKRVESVLDDNYFFDYKNLLHPIKYIKRLFKDFFYPKKN